jgi:hypothetical protein
MIDRKRIILGALLGGAALAALGKAQGVFPPPAPGSVLRYQTSCSLVEAGAADGYVSNMSGDEYSVRGEARFKFLQAGSLFRPELVVPVNSLIPPGTTVRVARARPAFDLQAGETCLFDVVKVIRRL